MGGFFQEIGLSIHIHRPREFTASGFLFDFTESVSSYEHEISVDGGFLSAKIGSIIQLGQLDDWIENGLGRHVIVYGPHGEEVWSGFVDSIDITVGPNTVTIGPLMEVANRISIEYTPYVDITVDPPSVGESTVTVIAEDAASQAKYGILEKMFSQGNLIDDATVGGGAANEAEQIRDAYLVDMKDPQISHRLSVGESSDNAITLSLYCKGYILWLDQYIYDNTFAGTITIPDKIAAMLAADPNSIFNTDYSKINDDAEFLLLTPDGEDGLRTAKEIIDEMVAQGTGDDERTMFGVYEERVAVFDKVPESIEYKFILSDNKQSVERTGTSEEGVPIPPYALRPGKWLLFADFLPGLAWPSADFRTDPRVQFIESVSYTAPSTFNLEGSRITKLPQLLKKMTLTL